MSMERSCKQKTTRIGVILIMKPKSTWNSPKDFLREDSRIKMITSKSQGIFLENQIEIAFSEWGRQS